MMRTASARSNGSEPAMSRRLTSTATRAIATAPAQSSTSPVWNALRSTSSVVSPYCRLIVRMLSTCSALRPNIFRVAMPRDHVQEVAAHPAQLGEPAAADRPGPAPDEREEQDEDRAGHHEHERRRRVDERDDQQDEHGHDPGEAPRRLVRRSTRRRSPRARRRARSPARRSARPRAGPGRAAPGGPSRPIEARASGGSRPAGPRSRRRTRSQRGPRPGPRARR